MPIGTTTPKKAIVALNSDDSSVKAINVEPSIDPEGNLDFSNPQFLQDLVWADWINLPIRPYDHFISTSKRQIRLPKVILTSNYRDVPTKTLKPTSKNIFERYNYTCAYTGKKLPKSKLNLDHVIPKSKGGKETWTNLVPAIKKINTEKGPRTPQEAGLRLLYKPTAPPPTKISVLITNPKDPSWIPFIIKK